VQGTGGRLATGNVFCVFEDSAALSGRASETASDIGLYRRNPRTGRFERFDESHGLPTLHQTIRPAAFAEDRAGQIWIGMLDGGLVRFRNEKFQQLPSSSGAPDQGVRAMLWTARGVCGSDRGDGLLRIDDPSKPTGILRLHEVEWSLEYDRYALAEDLDGCIMSPPEAA
jgi:hypothetical protein